MATRPAAPPRPPRPARPRRGCRSCLGLILLVLLAGGAAYLARRPLLRAVASFLVVSEDPVHSDLIIVHAGDRRRLAWGVDLYRRKLAPRLLVFVDPNMEAGFFGLGAEEALGLARESAERQGVAPDAIVFVRGVTSTWDEGIQAARYFREHEDVRMALVVSSPFHMRRIAAVYSHLLPEGTPRTVYVPMPWEWTGLSLDNWWTREQEVVWVQSEYTKLLFYYLHRFRQGVREVEAPPPETPAAPEEEKEAAPLRDTPGPEQPAQAARPARAPQPEKPAPPAAKPGAPPAGGAPAPGQPR